MKTKTPNPDNSERKILGARYNRGDILDGHEEWRDKVKLHIYFSPHGSAEDMEGLINRMPDADVWLFEGRGRSKLGAQKIFDKAAHMGGVDIEQVIDSIRQHDEPIRGLAMESMIRAVYGSGVAVGSIDLDTSLSDMQLGGDLHQVSLRDGLDKLNYSQAQVELARRVQKSAALDAEREERMVDNFADEMDTIITRRPYLLDKDEINVLMTIGAYHTSIGRRFDAAGVKSTREFSDNPYVYAYNSELKRAYTYGAEPSDELIKHSLSEFIVNKALDREFGFLDIKYEELAKYVRRYVGGLSDDDQEVLFKLYSQHKLSVENINLVLRDTSNYTKLLGSAHDILMDNKKLAKHHAQKMARVAEKLDDYE